MDLEQGSSHRNRWTPSWAAAPPVNCSPANVDEEDETHRVRHTQFFASVAWSCTGALVTEPFLDHAPERGVVNVHIGPGAVVADGERW